MPDFESLIVDNDHLKASRPQPIEDQSALFPDIAVDRNETPWVVWVQSDLESGERIQLKRFDESSPSDTLEVGSQSGIELQPCLARHSRDAIVVFWVAHRENAWHLLTRSYRDGALGEETVVASATDGLFHPRAAFDSDGTICVVCERVEGARTRLAVFRQSKGTWVERPFVTIEANCYRPDICAGPEGHLWIAYDAYVETTDRTGSYKVVLQTAPQLLDTGQASAPVIAVDNGYQNLHASLANDSQGNLWIAYASNRNDARRDPAWMTKWSYLLHFDGRSFFEPAGHRPGVDLYNEDSFQGWEFPAVGISRFSGENETALLFGQSAHSIVVQTYAGKTWSAPNDLVERNWGSWKPRCRVAGINPMYLASMGLQGAQIQKIEIANDPGEPPLLVPAGERLAAKPSKPALLSVRENRPQVHFDNTAYNLYFGDLHAHSAYSDAVGDIDEFYHRYRDAYGYDFATLTDHDFLDGIELTASELKLIWNHADRFSVDGAFIACYGYEWTSPALSAHAAEGMSVGEGHRHVLYPDQTGPLVKYGTQGFNTGRQLLEKLKGLRALVIPHHTSWSGTDWDAHDPELQRVVEIVSTHGRFEYPGNLPIGYRRDHIHPEKSIHAALDRGYRLGFVGGSDSHGLRWHAIELEGRAKHIREGTRVGWKEDAYRTGMTAILSESLDRESLFEAVYQRRCYATSGVPIFVDFRVNGSLMGSEIETSHTPKLEAKVRGTDAIRSIEVVRSGQVFAGTHMQPGEAIPTASLELEDTLIIPGESVYYYLRVTQEDGNMAWGSPIWVTYV